MKADKKALTEVLVITPDRVVYQGKARALSSENRKGKFDVLPFHSNFISIIYKRLVVLDDKGEKREFKIGRGVLHVYQNSIKVFLGV
jgi:F0F1-type ATP synthase epsilon subunit